MIYEYALDLKVARRKSGLSQEDCAHLLGVDQPRFSKMEAGKSTPSIYELSILCLVFDTPPSAIHDQIVGSLALVVGERLASLPDCPSDWPAHLNRQHTVDVLAQRLAGLLERGI